VGVSDGRSGVLLALAGAALCWGVAARGRTDARALDAARGAPSPGRSNPGLVSVAPVIGERPAPGATAGRCNVPAAIVLTGEPLGFFNCAGALDLTGEVLAASDCAGAITADASPAFVLSGFAVLDAGGTGDSANQSESRSSVLGPWMICEDFGGWVIAVPQNNITSKAARTASRERESRAFARKISARHFETRTVSFVELERLNGPCRRTPHL